MFDRKSPRFNAIPEWAWRTYDKYVAEVPLYDGEVDFREIEAHLHTIIVCGEQNGPRHKDHWRDVDGLAFAAVELSGLTDLPVRVVVGKIFEGHVGSERPWRSAKEAFKLYQEDGFRRTEHELEVESIGMWFDELHDRILSASDMQKPAKEVFGHLIKSLPFSQVLEAVKRYELHGLKPKASGGTTSLKSPTPAETFKRARSLSPTREGVRASNLEDWIHIYELESFVRTAIADR